MRVGWMIDSKDSKDLLILCYNYTRQNELRIASSWEKNYRSLRDSFVSGCYTDSIECKPERVYWCTKEKKTRSFAEQNNVNVHMFKGLIHVHLFCTNMYTCTCIILAILTSTLLCRTCTNGTVYGNVITGNYIVYALICNNLMCHNLDSVHFVHSLFSNME